jgi:hypothetical protein
VGKIVVSKTQERGEVKVSSKKSVNANNNGEVLDAEEPQEVTSDIYMATRIAGKFIQSVPTFVPKHFLVGAGLGTTDLLNETVALEAALKAAGVDHLNLLRLTSALPLYPDLVPIDERTVSIPVATPTPCIYNFKVIKPTGKKDEYYSVGLEFFKTKGATIVFEAESPLCKVKMPGFVHYGHCFTQLHLKHGSIWEAQWVLDTHRRKFKKELPIFTTSGNPKPKRIGIWVGIIVLP